MKERLIIQNFGPIKSMDLDLRKLTVLIGEQATGKSTVAKVLAVCRYFSYIVNYAIDVKDNKQFNNNEQFFEGLKKWGIDNYLTENSSITYINSLYKFEFKTKLVTEFESVIGDNDLDLRKEFYETETKINSSSKIFTDLLAQLESLRNDEFKKEQTSLFHISFWTPNENFFRLNVKKVMGNPMFIPTERGHQSLSIGNNSLVSDAIQDELSKLNRIVRGFNIEMNIEPLSITYKNQKGLGFVKRENDIDFHALHTGASGYQSAIPMVLAINFFTNFDKRERIFIIEEPEINLFPSAQKKLMAFFIKNVNENGHSFIIPTHSPYFLSAINDYLLAFKKGQINKEETSKIIKKEYWLDVKDISCYQLKNGKAYNIIDKKSGLISDNIIDDVSDDMNDEFENLLDIR